MRACTGKRCKFEFGPIIFSRVVQPLTKFAPRLHKVLFLGFAPNVTNGYFVMNKWDKIELTSNIADEPNFDAAVVLMEPTPKEPAQPPRALLDHPYEDKELEAVMGPEGGGGWYWGQDWNKPLVFGQPDDPMEVISKLQLAKVGDNLWQQEDIKPEEIPERLQE